jgi:hypothetical protein
MGTRAQPTRAKAEGEIGTVQRRKTLKTQQGVPDSMEQEAHSPATQPTNIPFPADICEISCNKQNRDDAINRCWIRTIGNHGKGRERKWETYFTKQSDWIRKAKQIRAKERFAQGNHRSDFIDVKTRMFSLLVALPRRSDWPKAVEGGR